MRRLKILHKERGVALLMVLLLLALLGSVVADFQYNSRVDLQLAINARDEIQAEYNAITALKVRALMLKNAKQLQSVVNTIIPDLPIAQVLEMVPVECGLLSAIARKVDSIEDESEDGEVDDFFQGECLATSQSEHSKISVNMLANRTNRASGQITNLMLGLLSDPKMERHFQEDDRNGTRAETPADLVGALSDWIDGDDDQEVNKVADEDRPYAFLKDTYRPKNAPFDSLSEIQLVHGIDDELFGLLKDHVSIHSDGTQIELATADNFTILLGLAASFHEGVTFTQIGGALGLFWARLAEMREIGGQGFAPLNLATLQALVTESGMDAFVDPAKLRQVFTDKTGTTWYTIEAQGRVGNAGRRIRAVFQANEGQFYYVRIE